MTIQTATVNTVKMNALHIPGRDLFDLIPHHPIQIIIPSIVLITGTEDGEILAAANMTRMREVLRQSMREPELKSYIHAWPRYMKLRFDYGCEQRQTTACAETDTLIINAFSLMKLTVIFSGKLNKFLDRTTNSFPNAERFLKHVAKPVSEGLPLMGNTAIQTSYSMEQGKLKWMLGR